MGLRFRQSIKVAPGVRVNIGAKSVGVSVGVPGFHVGCNSRTGAYVSMGIPGTGLSYRQSLCAPQRPQSASVEVQAGNHLVFPGSEQHVMVKPVPETTWNFSINSAHSLLGYGSAWLVHYAIATQHAPNG